ncbi:MAG: hypothetical protein J3K34DRAFT_279120 [Monoraphidium minutum]|nr:MAG: hypothetical protein J3K34DRAFT_279120 [Monoraphidium minutum]
MLCTWIVSNSRHVPPLSSSMQSRLQRLPRAQGPVQPTARPVLLRPIRPTRCSSVAASAAWQRADAAQAAPALARRAPLALHAQSPRRAQRPARGSAPRRRVRCAALLPRPAGGAPLIPDDLPEGLRIEAAPEGSQGDIEYDEESKVVRIPLSATDGGRRTKLVMFTCNKCGGRSARLVNPLAWEKGAVFCQCQNCDVWHMLAANNPKIVEEIRYDDPEGQRGRREALLQKARAEVAADAAAGAGGDSMDSADTAVDPGLGGGGGGGVSSRP